MSAINRERWGLCALLLAVFVWTLSPLAGFDFWFYIAVGRDIVATGNIPWAESYLGTTRELSFGRYADFAWLGNVVSYACFAAMGPVGLVLLKSWLVTATVGLTYINCKNVDLSPFWAAAWSGLALWTIRGRLEMRLYLISDLALAALVFILIREETRSNPKKHALGAFLLCMAWTNLHQGIVAGLLVGVSWLVFGRAPVRARLAISGAALLGCATRPNPLSFPAFLFDHFSNTSAMTGVVEWAAPSRETFLYQLGPFLLCLLILVPLGVWRLRQSRATAPPWAYLIVASLFLVLALRSIRSISELLPVVCPLAAAYFPKTPSTPSLRWAVATVLAVLFGATFSLPRWPDLARTTGYPTALVDSLPKGSGQVLNSFEFGNYLVYRRIPPFIHGMSALYSEALIKDFESVLNPSAEREAILRRFGVGSALLHLPQKDDATLSLVDWLFDSSNWKLLVWDDTGLLFVRGDHREGLQHVRPWRTPRWTDPQAAERELEELIEKRPSAQAHLFLSELLLERGDVASSNVQANKATELEPYFAPAWAQLGKAYARVGNLEGVLQASAGEVRAGDAEPGAHYNRALALSERARLTSGPGSSWDTLCANYEARRALWLDPAFAPARALLDRL